MASTSGFVRFTTENEWSAEREFCEDTGVFLLAQAGRLGASRVTTHWEDIADLRQAFPALEVQEGVRWVDNGDLVTSAGISAGIDMSLHLVERLHSRELALRTARQLDFDWTENR